MSRTLTADALAQLSAPSTRPFLLYEGDFASGWVRLWSGFGDLTWDGQTWTGIGWLVGLSTIEETGEVAASGIRVSLNGVDSSVVAIALAEVRQNRSGKVWLGFLEEAATLLGVGTDALGEAPMAFGLRASDAIVADPILLFAGRCDIATIDERPDGADIAISYESRLIDLERPRIRRWTHEDQKTRDATDRGFEYVAGLQDAVIEWGRAAAPAAASGPTVFGQPVR